MIPLGVLAGSRHVPSGGGGVYFADDFNRADADSLGDNWNNNASTGKFAIVNNAAQTIEYPAVAFSTTAAATDDYYVEATIISGQGSASRGIIARSSGAGVEEGYLWRYSSGSCALFKTPGGNNYAQVGGNYATPTALPITLRLEVQGNTIRGYANGVLLATLTDTSHPTGRYGGMRRISAAGDASFDDFEIGAL